VEAQQEDRSMNREPPNLHRGFQNVTR